MRKEQTDESEEIECTSLERRGFLKSVGASTAGMTLFVAGCCCAQQTCLVAEPVSVEDVAPSVSIRLDDISDKTATHLGSGGLPTEKLSDVRGENRRVARQAVQEGTAHTYGIRLMDTPTRRNISPTAWRVPVYVRTDQTYYRIDRKRSGTADLDRWLLRAERVDSSSLDEQPVPLDDIDTPKRVYIERAKRGSFYFRAERDDEEAQEETLTRPPKLATTEDQFQPFHPEYVHVFRESDSNPTEIGLAPDPDPTHIEMPDEDVVRLTADKRTIVEPRFTYTGTRIGNATEFMEHYATDLDESSLSSDQRALFEEAATTDEYEITDADEDYDSETIVGLREAVDTRYAWFDDKLYNSEGLWEERCFARIDTAE